MVPNGNSGESENARHPPPLPIARDAQAKPARVEVVEEGGGGSSGAPAQTWLHPLSGAIILLLDWICFGGEVLTLELAQPILSILAFLITTTGVLVVQRFFSKDRWGQAIMKAVLGGILAGFPTPIFGTIVGAWVILASGLSRFSLKAKQ